MRQPGEKSVHGWTELTTNGGRHKKSSALSFALSYVEGLLSSFTQTDLGQGAPCPDCDCHHQIANIDCPCEYLTPGKSCWLPPRSRPIYENWFWV